jgi:hypothetical protein
MSDPIPPQSNFAPTNSEPFGTVQNDSETFRTVPQPSEQFRSIPQTSESFRSVPKMVERKENHSLTVREVARMFEAAGVARTERSIINWCQPNKMGVARLDHYFDPNERKYFISPQSVEAAIQEEKAKASKSGETSGTDGSLRKDSETLIKSARNTMLADETTLRDLKNELMDLKITNRAKDQYIERLHQDRDGFQRERQEYIEKLMSFNRKVGELETKLLQLEQPKDQG